MSHYFKSSVIREIPGEAHGHKKEKVAKPIDHRDWMC